MKLLKSKRFPLPTVYLVEDEKELSTIPIGIPFIRGNAEDFEEYVRLLEFEILLQSALKTGMSFRWEEILKDNGYDNLIKSSTLSSHDGKDVGSFMDSTVREYVRDISYHVNFETLKRLHIIPSFFGSIEEVVKENITNTILFNPYLYNKKLEMAIGDVVPTSPERNLIIIDISGSIPKSISESTLLLSKTMATQFYADLLITGSRSTLYSYNEVGKLDVKKIYKENGTDNDQLVFMKLVSSRKKYNCAIVFGDNHHPGQQWRNEFNSGTKSISYKEGKKLCKWSVNKIISLHTECNNKLAGYATWFNCKTIEYQNNWVKYLS